MTKSTPLPPGQHRPEHDPGLCPDRHDNGAVLRLQASGRRQPPAQMLEAVLHHCHGDQASQGSCSGRRHLVIRTPLSACSGSDNPSQRALKKTEECHPAKVTFATIRRRPNHLAGGESWNVTFAGTFFRFSAPAEVVLQARPTSLNLDHQQKES